MHRHHFRVWIAYDLVGIAAFTAWRSWMPLGVLVLGLALLFGRYREPRGSSSEREELAAS